MRRFSRYAGLVGRIGFTLNFFCTRPRGTNMKSRLSAYRVGVMALGGIAMSEGTALGQAIQLEEVVVTARRVEENLLAVPMPITALTANDLAKANFKDLVDLKNYTPG